MRGEQKIHVWPIVCVLAMMTHVSNGVIPPIFIRAYFPPTSDGQTTKVAISSSNNAQYFYCDSECPQATVCKQLRTGKRTGYIFEETYSTCFGDAATYSYAWDNLKTLTVSSSSPSGNTQSVITISCNESIWGNANFTLTEISTASSPTAIFSGQHRCACYENVYTQYCNQQGVIPSNTLDDFSNRLSDTISHCGQQDLIDHIQVMIILSCVCLGLLFFTDLITVMAKKKSGLHGYSWLQCMCCSCCNIFSAPSSIFFTENAKRNSKKLTQLLFIFATPSTTFIALSAVRLMLFTNVAEQFGSKTLFAVSVTLILFILTAPITACSNCSFPQIGYLLGIVYCMTGAYVCLDPAICYLGQSVPAYSLEYLPSGLFFCACGGLYCHLLLSSIRPLGWSIFTFESLAEPTYATIPDTSLYVTSVLQPNTQSKSSKTHYWFLSSGEARMLAAQTLSLTILMGFLLYWHLLVTGFSSFLEIIISGGVCCNDISCYEKAGAPSISDRSSSWRKPVPELSWLLLNENSASNLVPVISFPGDCASVGRYRQGCYIGLLTIGLVVCACIFWYFSRMRKRFIHRRRDIQKGKSTLKGFNKANANAAQIKGMFKYMGMQVIYVLIGCIWNTIFLSSCFLGIAAVVILPMYGITPNLWPTIYHYLIWDDGQPKFLLILVFNYFLLSAFIVFLRNRNKFLLSFAVTFQQFFYIFNGVGSLIERLVASIFVTLLGFFEMDLQIVPGPAWLDTGYFTYLRMLEFDSFHTNKIMLAFAKTLLINSEARQRHHYEDEQTDDSMLISNQPVMEKVRTRCSNRWALAYTLVNNPSLIADRRQEPTKRRQSRVLETLNRRRKRTTETILANTRQRRRQAKVLINRLFSRKDSRLSVSYQELPCINGTTTVPLHNYQDNDISVVVTNSEIQTRNLENNAYDDISSQAEQGPRDDDRDSDRQQEVINFLEAPLVEDADITSGYMTVHPVEDDDFHYKPSCTSQYDAAATSNGESLQDQLDIHGLPSDPTTKVPEVDQQIPFEDATMTNTPNGESLQDQLDIHGLPSDPTTTVPEEDQQILLDEPPMYSPPIHAVINLEHEGSGPGAPAEESDNMTAQPMVDVDVDVNHEPHTLN